MAAITWMLTNPRSLKFCMTEPDILNHALIAPILLPLLAAALLLAFGQARLSVQRAISLLSCSLQLLLALYLLALADSSKVTVYLLGNWPAEVGVSLLLDRLAALMLCLCALLGLLGALYATSGDDRAGRHFHTLWQFLLMGLNGAFLTHDLFNLFVFYEVLLIASYGLLLHGGGGVKLKRSFHFVTFNLVGSALFLLAAAMFYGLLGTLNLSELALRIRAVSAADVPLVQAAGYLLLVVFCIKAALLPLNLWLPRTYAAAPAAAAILFALMTKVGVYSILRVYFLAFGEQAGPLEDLVWPLLGPVGLLTLAFAALGAFASRRLRPMLGFLVVASAGTMLIGIASNSALALSAALYYLVHSTLALALMFALSKLLAPRLGAADQPQPQNAHPNWLILSFVLGALAISGLPPMSGFIAKVQLLEAIEVGTGGVNWAVILLSGLLAILALARQGARLFWRKQAFVFNAPGRAQACVVGVMCVLLVCMSVFAAPLIGYTRKTAEQLVYPASAIDAVKNTMPIVRTP